jgi:hypothetical protein
MRQRRTLQARLEAVDTLWEVVVLLVRRWQERPPMHVPPYDSRNEDDVLFRRWGDVRADVADWFSDRETGGLTEADHHELQKWLRGGDLDMVHAVASGIDSAAWATFYDSWRDSLPPGDGTYVLREHDVYPVNGFREESPAKSRSSRPESISSPLSDEFPHVRIHTRGRHEPIEVVVDFRFEAQLADVLDRLETVATVHPNVGFREFVWPEKGFPIAAEDAERQDVLMEALLTRAVRLGAQVVVAPELSASEETFGFAQTLVDDADPPVLVVPGSIHERRNGVPTNTAYGFLSDRDERLAHRKIIPFILAFRRRPVREGIVSERRITIYSAKRARVAFLICKDMLDEGVFDTVQRIGANVVLVPSMSQKTDSYAANVLALATKNHAVVVFGNGPLRWGLGDPAEPMAIFGQPVAGVQHVPAKASGDAGTARGVMAFSLGDRKARWYRLRGKPATT